MVKSYILCLRVAGQKLFYLPGCILFMMRMSRPNRLRSRKFSMIRDMIRGE